MAWLLSKASPLTPILFGMSVFDGPNAFIL